MMRNFLSVILLALLAGMGFYYGSPYYATWRLEQAAKGGDAATIASFTDFPAVRANLSPHLATELQANIDAAAQAKPGSILDKLGDAIGPVLGIHSSGALVTPDGLAVMMKTAAAPKRTLVDPAAREADAANPGEPYTISQGYIDNDFDLFHVTIGNRLKPENEVTLKLLRRGMLTWRVTSIDLNARSSAESRPGADQ